MPFPRIFFNGVGVKSRRVHGTKLFACRHVRMTAIAGYFIPPPAEPRNDYALTMCHFYPYLCFTRRALTVACFLFVRSKGVALFCIQLAYRQRLWHLTWNRAFQSFHPQRRAGVETPKPGNRYFTRRINTPAAAVYHAGKIEWLLVSGDVAKILMNLRRAASADGESCARRPFCDYAGFSRNGLRGSRRKVFGESRITIISQAFRVIPQRDVWLAQQYGISAVGVNARRIWA